MVLPLLTGGGGDFVGGAGFVGIVGLLWLFGLLCGLDPGLVGRFGGFGCFGTLFFFFNCLKIGDFFGFRLSTFGLFGGSSGI